MTDYRVTLQEPNQAFTTVFDCQATTHDSAEEQALAAYPDAEIISTFTWAEEMQIAANRIADIVHLLEALHEGRPNR